MNGHDLDSDLYHALFDYYSDHGEMPYGVAKARDADPFDWVSQRFEQDAHQYVTESVDSVLEGKNPWLNLSYSNSTKVGDKKKTSKGEVEYTKTGQVHRSTKRYGGDDPENVKDDDNSGDGEEKEKRGRGRPRTRPLPDENAPKKSRGRPRKNPLPDANAPKRGRGRPKKVREWIETLRFVAESRK
jgi:hypothetical protein